MIGENSITLEEGEVTLEKVRKHWIVYVEDLFIHVCGALLLTGVAIVLLMKDVLPFINGDDKASIGMVSMGVVLLIWCSFFYFWTKNYFDVWHVTDRHIIAVNQKDILNREEAFMELSRVQDVSFEKNGLIATYFGYGSLKVQTAGEDKEFIMEDVRAVEDVAHHIIGLRNKARAVSAGL